MKRMLACVAVVLCLFAGTLLWTQSTTPAAPALRTLKALPAAWSVEAASEAVQTCQVKGYNVSATVVGADGLRQVVIRGDGATPHTIENSYNKAYTMITLGPIQKKDTTGEIQQAVTRPAFSTSMPPSALPGLTFVPGGIAIKVDGQIIAGLGVSGAPDGNIDEGCARAGLAKIQAHLKQ